MDSLGQQISIKMNQIDNGAEEEWVEWFSTLTQKEEQEERGEGEGEGEGEREEAEEMRYKTIKFIVQHFYCNILF
mgnify:CR=1 FL=1